METDYLLQKDDGSAYTDPHVWMDVSGWLRAIPVVAETLAVYDPENAEAYRIKATVYANNSKPLMPMLKRRCQQFESQRVLVTAHDAFQYLGRAYGIEVRGIKVSALSLKRAFAILKIWSTSSLSARSLPSLSKARWRIKTSVP